MSRRLAAGLAVTLLAGLTQVLSAQNFGARYDTTFTPVCKQGRTMPIDTAIVTFVAQPGIDDDGWRVRGDDRRRAQHLARILGDYFVAPATAGLPQPQGWHRGRGRGQSERNPLPDSWSALAVRFDSGRVGKVQWDNMNESPELTAAILNALLAADSAGALVGVAGDDGSTVHLAFAAVDSVGADDHPLMLLRAAYYPLERGIDTREVPVLVYPRQYLTSRTLGRLDISYVIGTNGRVVPATLVVESSPHAAFAAEYRELLLRMRFTPARGHGCRVSAFVRQSITIGMGQNWRFHGEHGGRPPLYPGTGR